MKVEELYVPSARGEGNDSFWGEMKNPFHKLLGNFYLTARKLSSTVQLELVSGYGDCLGDLAGGILTSNVK